MTWSLLASRKGDTLTHTHTHIQRERERERVPPFRGGGEGGKKREKRSLGREYYFTMDRVFRPLERQGLSPLVWSPVGDDVAAATAAAASWRSFH